MNGWQRIGVVLSIVFGVPAFLIAYGQNDSAWGYVDPTDEVRKLKGQEFWTALYRQAQKNDPDKYEGCIERSVRMQAPTSMYSPAYTVTCDKTVIYAASQSIGWGLLPGIIIWIIGATVGWIVAGFRSNRS